MRRTSIPCSLSFGPHVSQASIRSTMPRSQMRAIRRGSEENAITTFTAAHKLLKDAIQRVAELSQA